MKAIIKNHMQNPNKIVLAAILLASGMACFGSSTPVSKIVGGGLPVLMAAGIRMLLAGLVLLPFALWRSDHLFRLTKRDWWLVVSIAVIGNMGFSVAMLYGMQMISGVLGSIIMSLAPAITALGAVLFLSEKMNRRKVFALGLGVVGVLIMQLSTGTDRAGSQIFLGIFLVIIAICCEAAYTLMGKAATKEMTPLKLATLSALVAGFLMLPLIGYQSLSVIWQDVSPREWLSLIWWGIGTMALGSLLWYSGVQKVPGHVASAFMAVMPISAVVLSYILLDESFDWLHIPGFSLAIGGVLLMAWEDKKRVSDKT